MAENILNVLIKNVIDKIRPSDPAPVPQPKPSILSTVAEEQAARVRPYIVPSTPAAPKVESTQVTYGQQYQVQSYNADGTIGIRTISLSELQKNDVKFDDRRAELTDAVKKEEATLLQGVHLPNRDVQLALIDGLYVDYLMTLKSQESQILEMNLLQTPKFKSEMRYNFYMPDESNIAHQEDPKTDPFLAKGATDDNVPMFVNLSWQPVDTVVECQDFDPKTAEEEAIIQMFLKPVRGASNASNANSQKVQTLLAQTNALSRDGVTLELTDTHDLATAFNSISNSAIFKNSILTVMNTNATDLNKIDFNDILIDEL